MRKTAVMLCLALPVAASAGQPISESFVECAQLFDMSNRQEPARRATDKGAALEYAAAQLMQAAADEAAREGRRAIPAYVAEMAEVKASRWDAEGVTYVLSQDFRDWMGYCKSLAKSRGVALTR